MSPRRDAAEKLLRRAVAVQRPTTASRLAGLTYAPATHGPRTLERESPELWPAPPTGHTLYPRPPEPHTTTRALKHARGLSCLWPAPTTGHTLCSRPTHTPHTPTPKRGRALSCGRPPHRPHSAPDHHALTKAHPSQGLPNTLTKAHPNQGSHYFNQGSP